MSHPLAQRRSLRYPPYVFSTKSSKMTDPKTRANKRTTPEAEPATYSVSATKKARKRNPE